MKHEEMDEFAFLWEEYAHEKDNKLTKGAIELKQQVIEFVKSLPTLPRDLRNEQVKSDERNKSNETKM